MCTRRASRPSCAHISARCAKRPLPHSRFRALRGVLRGSRDASVGTHRRRRRLCVDGCAQVASLDLPPQLLGEADLLDRRRHELRHPRVDARFGFARFHEAQCRDSRAGAPSVRARKVASADRHPGGRSARGRDGRKRPNRGRGASTRNGHATAATEFPHGTNLPPRSGLSGRFCEKSIASERF